MENKKKAKVDYAAIIREFEMCGHGRSLKHFCDDSCYVYSRKPPIQRKVGWMKNIIFATVLKFA